MHDRCVTILLKGHGYDVMWEYDEFTGMFMKGIWKYLTHAQIACTRLFFPSPSNSVRMRLGKNRNIAVL